MAAGELLQLDPGKRRREQKEREEREGRGPSRTTSTSPPCSPSKTHPHPRKPTRTPETPSRTASELRFRFELRKNVTATLSLHNPGSDCVAFKLKTTAPKKFAVRPSSGIVEPGTTKEVHVSFHSTYLPLFSRRFFLPVRLRERARLIHIRTH